MPSPPSADASRRPAFAGDLRGMLIMLLASGLAALGYELVWSQGLALIVGSDAVGSICALAGYFLGLAAGSLWVQRDLRRAKLSPFRRLAVLEAGAAAFALASPWLLTLLGPSLASMASASAPLRAMIASLAILPGTFCVGAIVPLAVEGRRRERAEIDPQSAPRDAAREASLMYAAYTLGGVLGVLLCAFVTMPRGGMWPSALCLASIGGVASLLAWSRSRAPLGRVQPSAQQAPSPPKQEDAGWLLFVAGFTGLLGIALEVVALRVLGQIFSGTVYTFAIVIATMLIFTSLGAAINARLCARWPQVFAAEHGGGLFACLLILSASVSVSAALASTLASDHALVMLERSFAQRCAFEAQLSAALLGAPALAMGMVYAQILGATTGRGVGHAVALNNLGAALAPLLVAFTALPAWGLTQSWFGIALGYLGLAIGWGWLRRRSPAHLGMGMLACLSVMGMSHHPLAWIQLPEGWQVLARNTTAQGVVILAEQITPTSQGERLKRLQVDQLFRMGGAWSIGERRMGALATLFAPQAKHALFLGVGTGATMGGALAAPLERIDGVELIPEILTHVPRFANVNAQLHADPRVHLHAADARAWLAASPQRYDLIVGDLFHPERDGAGRLFSREHFAGVAAHLNEDGVFVQWLPLHQLDARSFASIVRAFVDNFAQADAWLGLYNVDTPALALVGRARAFTLSRVQVEQDLARPNYRALALGDVHDFFAGHLCDRAGLVALAGDQAANRDLFPVVSYRAPLRSPETQGLPRGAARLKALLAHRGPTPSSWLRAEDPSQQAEFVAYADALGHFLEGEIAEARGAQPTQAAAHWLEAYATMPRLGLARARLLRLAHSSPPLAAKIVQSMLRVTPHDAQLQALSQQLRGGNTVGRDSPPAHARPQP